jgi:hypothetical protein
LHGQHFHVMTPKQLSDEQLRRIAERIVWEVVQRPPPDPSSFFSAQRFELAPKEEERLDVIVTELERSGRAARIRAQRKPPPWPGVEP